MFERTERPHPGPRLRKALYVFYAVCAVLLVLDLAHWRHAEHPLEGYFGFYGFYGFVACVALVLLAKDLRKLVMRREDYYGDRSARDNTPPGDGDA